MIPSRCVAQGRTLQCLRDIAAGASYLHSADILHGDLKPANVLLQSCASASRSSLTIRTPGCTTSSAGSEALARSAVTCKLADFGLSRELSAGASHLTTHSFGTVTHMPPELLRDGILGRAADVYSFAMISTLPAGAFLHCLAADACFHRV